MKFLILFCFILGLSGCNDQVLNSNSFDESRYSGVFEGGPKFQAIAPVLVEKCAGCHPGWSSFSYLDYEAAGLVVRSNVGLSSVYYRLSNSPVVGPGARNMPQGGTPAFTDLEVELLEEWINDFDN